MMPSRRHLPAWMHGEYLGRYVAWRAACDAVREAYAAWAAGGCGRGRAFAAYVAALDREERAAHVHRVHAQQLAAAEA
jgi:hypothetical protein